MTNRQWLIWQLIDMPDDEFADKVCGYKEVWSCEDCEENKIKPMVDGCRKKLHEWLKQEHK